MATRQRRQLAKKNSSAQAPVANDAGKPAADEGDGQVDPVGSVTTSLSAEAHPSGEAAAAAPPLALRRSPRGHAGRKRARLAEEGFELEDLESAVEDEQGLVAGEDDDEDDALEAAVDDEDEEDELDDAYVQPKAPKKSTTTTGRKRGRRKKASPQDKASRLLDQRRKHNAVERRRKKAMRELMQELYSLLPASGAKKTQLSILRAAIDYIRQLQGENEQLRSGVHPMPPPLTRKQRTEPRVREESEDVTGSSSEREGEESATQSPVISMGTASPTPMAAPNVQSHHHHPQAFPVHPSPPQSHYLCPIGGCPCQPQAHCTHGYQTREYPCDYGMSHPQPPAFSASFPHPDTPRAFVPWPGSDRFHSQPVGMHSYPHGPGHRRTDETGMGGLENEDELLSIPMGPLSKAEGSPTELAGEAEVNVEDYIV